MRSRHRLLFVTLCLVLVLALAPALAAGSRRGGLPRGAHDGVPGVAVGDRPGGPTGGAEDGPADEPGDDTGLDLPDRIVLDAEVLEALRRVSPEAMPGLRAAAGVIRDRDGIPHIYATNLHDLFFMQGFVHATDRLFQMDLTRRQASGTLAELFGPAVLGSDVELRTLGLRRAAMRSLEASSDELKQILAAYAEGVNAYVDRAGLPLEYQLLEIGEFEPWTPLDSMTIAKAIAFNLSFDLDIGPTQALLTYIATGDALGFDGQAAFFADVFRAAPFDPASTLPDAGAEPPWIPIPGARRDAARDLRDAARRLSPRALELAAGYTERVKEIPLLEPALTPGRADRGSNEWAVSGALTASGRPLVANDPHLALNTPSTFHQLGLRGPGIDVIGSSFPGTPLIVQGQNPWIAWGSTVNPMDVTDVFQERIVPDPDSPSGLSIVHEEVLEPIIPIPETFRYNQPGDGVPDNLATAAPGSVVGGVVIPPATLIVPRRNNGPIVALDTDEGVALSVQYVGFSATRELDAFLVWSCARGLDDFVRGLQLFDVGSQNWIYGDVDGNIAYFTSGELPLREDLQANRVEGLPPAFIRNGEGGNEWLALDGDKPETQALDWQILPFEEMPQVVNPPAGWVINANNDPAGVTLDNDPLNQLRRGGGIYYLSPGYSLGMRAGRITRRLRAALAEGPVDRETMKSIQADVVALDTEVFVPLIADAFANAAAEGAPEALAALAADDRVADAVARLAAWDGWQPTGVAEGYDESDENGVRLEPGDDEVAASIAATIYAVWRGQFAQTVIDGPLAARGLPGPGNFQTMTALRNLVEMFPFQHGVGFSGIDFFAVEGVDGLDTPEQRRDYLVLASLARALDLLSSDAFAPAFGGSDDPQDWRWGRLHRLVLDHPLGGPFDVPPAGGAIPPSFPDLPGFAVDGGLDVPDASNHGVRADAWDEFMFGAGPNRRYVGELGPRARMIDAETSLPGGPSGVLGSPLYANLLERWLTNDTYPVRNTVQKVLDAFGSARLFVPRHFDPPARRFPRPGGDVPSRRGGD
ncbi:MAG: penicillin acylase family protein [Acidobacteriota bacterium]